MADRTLHDRIVSPYLAPRIFNINFITRLFCFSCAKSNPEKSNMTFDLAHGNIMSGLCLFFLFLSYVPQSEG